MTTASVVDEIDTTVQAIRREPHLRGFTNRLSHVVSVIGNIPDSPPERFTADTMIRLRKLAEEAVEAVESRIDSGDDADKVQQELAGTVYEIRRRMEAVEIWFRHFTNEP